MNLDCTKSKIWQGVNRNLLKLQKGKPKFAQIIGSEIFHEGSKPIFFQITRMKLKKKYFIRRKT